MISYNFLQSIYDFVKTYRDFPFPVLICDREFQVHWSNASAKEQCYGLTQPRGVLHVLEALGVEEVRTKAEAAGVCTLRQVFPPADLCLSLSPIHREGEIVGFLVLFVREEALSPEPAWSTPGPDALSQGVRLAVNGIFAALDDVALRADMMRSSWLKPGLSQVGVIAYAILRIVNNVTLYARYLQHGGAQLQVEAVNLRRLMSRIEQVVGELCGPAGIAVRFEPVPESLCASLDVEQFEVAFYNLLHNSILYTRPGNRITVSVAERGRRILVRVEDRGRGIPDGEVASALSPYLSRSPEGGRAGIGLGLPLAKLIAEAHGGSLLLESGEREGTAVSLLLPEVAFSQPLSLAQERERGEPGERFSNACVGLMDAVYAGRGPAQTPS